MASRLNDTLLDKAVEGSYNYYDGHRSCGTAQDKGLAARLGGHNYNIVTNDDKDEIYFTNMRHGDHFVDGKGRHTIHMFGDRRRKFARDERDHVAKCLRAPEAHPRFQELPSQRRVEVQLAQIENHASYADFQKRCRSSLFPQEAALPPKRYSIHNRRYANEMEKLRPRASPLEDWKRRRGEPMSRSFSAPSVSVVDSARSLQEAVRQDARKEATQRQTESANFAPWSAGNTYSHSLDCTGAGRRLAASQDRCSVNRVENYDFGITRKNNHYSSHDKLTRSDPFFMRPRLGGTNSSVKYDIINNERKWFKYAA